MTDRFYPLGLPSEEDAWKSTYEAQNEMRSFARSAYPPGYAGHEPGAREKFGFSQPGPDPWRLTKSELVPREETDIAEPRRIHAVPRMRVTDDSQIFRGLDMAEMERSYRSPLASTSGRSKIMARPRSLPSLTSKPVPPRRGQIEEPNEKLEDDEFSYFVPEGLQREQKERLFTRSLSKLHKSPDHKISLPFTGEGTGFKYSCNDPGIFKGPECMRDNVTSYKAQFGKPSFFRHDPFPTGST